MSACVLLAEYSRNLKVAYINSLRV